MTRPRELEEPQRKQVTLDKPTLDILRKIDPNLSRAIRLVAKWHTIAADRDERTRTRPVEVTGR